MTVAFKLLWDAKCSRCQGVMLAGTFAEYSEGIRLDMWHINGCPKPSVVDPPLPK
jgi:hypothetical protein